MAPVGIGFKRVFTENSGPRALLKTAVDSLFENSRPRVCMKTRGRGFCGTLAAESFLENSRPSVLNHRTNADNFPDQAIVWG